jgi:hypothetical protein
MSHQGLNPLRHLAASAATALLLAGCLDGGGDEQGFGSGATPPPPPANSAPVISGSPPVEVEAGSAYSFTPGANDANNDPLTFTVDNLPGWASFDETTGRISGTPGDADVGVYEGIVIRVSDGAATDSLGPFSITVQSMVAGNSAPVISGSPPAEVVAGSAYSFTPGADDADNDPLTFTVDNLPGWASFNETNGQISGTPGDADVGVYEGIVIRVSDGSATGSLGPFSITVQPMDTGTGSVTLNWTAPTQNEDGSALTDLAGYRIYWGTTPGSYPNSVTVDNPGLTTYVVEGLVAGTYEFVATAFNTAGVESRYSSPATKTVE